MGDNIKEYSAEFMKFLSQLAAATGDLSSMTCPAFLLNGYSLLEYSQHWGDHPDLLWDMAQENLTDEERSLAVLKWFISTLHGSYRSRCESSSERKPFNPILGETFRATWKDTDSKGWGESSLFVEQVSHHPPVSAFCVQLPSSPTPGSPSVTVQGHCGQRTTFNTTAIIVKQVGRVKINIQCASGEEHVYTIYPLPELSVSGLLTMSIYVELLGKTRIICNSGTTIAELEFVPVGWFSGEHFSIKGTVKSTPSASKPYCTISGKWTEESLVTLTDSSSTSTLFSVAESQPSQRYVPSLDKQLPTESLNLWGPVVEQLKKGNYAQASDIKVGIEETQRAIRKSRIENKESWEPSYFKFVVAGPGDAEGTTKRDPQHTGGEHSDDLGHWMRK